MWTENSAPTVCVCVAGNRTRSRPKGSGHRVVSAVWGVLPQKRRHSGCHRTAWTRLGHSALSWHTVLHRTSIRHAGDHQGGALSGVLHKALVYLAMLRTAAGSYLCVGPCARDRQPRAASARLGSRLRRLVLIQVPQRWSRCDCRSLRTP